MWLFSLRIEVYIFFESAVRSFKKCAVAPVLENFQSLGKTSARLLLGAMLVTPSPERGRPNARSTGASYRPVWLPREATDILFL